MGVMRVHLFFGPCDPLAGVGIRGIHYAKEVGGISMVVVDDRSHNAKC